MNESTQHEPDGCEVFIKETLKINQLTPDEHMAILRDSLSYFGVDIQNPFYKRAIQDYVMRVLGVEFLPEPTERWVRVVERAKELGFNQAKKPTIRRVLGRYVSKHGKDNLTSKKEKRLYNGTLREIKQYLLTDELDHLINEFFDS